MHKIQAGPDFPTWRAQARAMLLAGRSPDEVLWHEADDTQSLLIPDDPPSAPLRASSIRVPREYADLAEDVFHHRNPQRFWVMYRLLWRIAHGERDLLKIEVDDDMRQARVMQRQVKHDAHRMTGFVRFEKTADAEGELFVAWYRPDHHVLPLCAGSFVRRFRDQRWSILTPEDSAHWDRSKLRFGPGVEKRPTNNDQLVAMWKAYYTSTYNPQRDNPKLFRQLVPTRFLADMPEGDAAYAIRSRRSPGKS